MTDRDQEEQELHSSSGAEFADSGAERAATKEQSTKKGWICFLLLWLLFDAPQVLQAGGFSFPRLRPSLDPALLAGAYLLSFQATRRVGHALRSLLGGLAALLFLYSMDDAVWRFLMRQEPLLYDQFVMIRHALVLVGDLLSPVVLALVASALAAALALAFLARALVFKMRASWVGESRAQPWTSGPSRVFLKLSALTLSLGTLLLSGAPLSPRSVMGQASEDIWRSTLLHRRLQAAIRTSEYKSYASIKLERKPRVELFFVESYGRLLSDDPSLRPMWHGSLRTLEEGARLGGLTCASSFSVAPVSGGRSWIAEGSVLLGTKIEHEVVFRDVISQIDRIPHLVGFFEQQGYETVLLAPADRVRLGLENENRYDYDQTLTFADLDYPGPHIGWGRIPDQYSLARAENSVLNRSKAPVFFNFHMVSSHAPWEQVPEWDLTLSSETAAERDMTAHPPRKGEAPEQQAEETAQRAAEKTAQRAAEKTAELKKRLRRLRRDEDHVFASQGKLDKLGRKAYARAIEYELSVIRHHLMNGSGDRLILVLGDHQPPIVTEAQASFEVPIHVFSSDPLLLEEFFKHGFEPGTLPKGRSPIRHEALFSLVVRTLATCCSRSVPKPEVKRHGAPLVN